MGRRSHSPTVGVLTNRRHFENCGRQPLAIRPLCLLSRGALCKRRPLTARADIMYVFIVYIQNVAHHRPRDWWCVVRAQREMYNGRSVVSPSSKHEKAQTHSDCRVACAIGLCAAGYIIYAGCVALYVCECLFSGVGLGVFYLELEVKRSTIWLILWWYIVCISRVAMNSLYRNREGEMFAHRESPK